MQKHKTKADRQIERQQRDLDRFLARVSLLSAEEIQAIQKALQKAIDSVSQ